MRAAVGQDAALVGRVLDLAAQRALPDEVAQGDHHGGDQGGEHNLDQEGQIGGRWHRD